MKFKYLIVVFSILIVVFTILFLLRQFNFNFKYHVGLPIDSLNGVVIYYNGVVDNKFGRNLTADNYNLGIKFQCVEFVKRYYYEHLNHKMPNSYGNAIDFFDPKLVDGQKNQKRNLTQYTNPSNTKPRADDLLIYGATHGNKFGHVAIVSSVIGSKIEIVQQNPGKFGKSREAYSLINVSDKWKIKNNRILGWLRKE